ncbi:HAMP domain-containing histidine kinase [Paenalkalicoccus suaedae]|uniref:histidine kinase n=1 Tax=Paenalkalicoccus suaedae TaxID=2592382 RepID=A0A859F9G7_9BACI|nr:HAMP domain-containing sensor histidine kinase [Paenalkalicoccus suaedae]QKS69773.1 HAMP domain-containing histidine kinase [Paenalkalicoccus suaedae]
MGKRKSMFQKLFLTYSTIILSSFLLFGCVFLYIFHLQLYSDYEETFVYHYDKVTEQIQTTESLAFSLREVEAFLLPSLVQQEYSMYLFGDDMSLLIGPPPDESRERLIKPEFVTKALEEGITTEGGRIDGELSYSVGAPIQLPGMLGGQGALVMVFHDLDHQYMQVLSHILITIAITIAFAAVVLWIMSKRITSPLREMNRVVRKYAKGDFSEFVDATSSDEIGQLGESVTYMAKELRTLEETRNNLVADVAHDLRSPLTSIKGFLIALADGTVPHDRKDRVYALMRAETERIITLVNDTLDMSQLEAGQVTMVPEPYEINEQVAFTVAKLAPQLEAKQMTIHVEAPYTDTCVMADRNRMEQVFINLLQNAIQFSPRGSEVVVHVEVLTKTIAIRITDQGPGIEEGQISEIWKRFYKADKARTNKAGSGIGLSIVKSILDQHDVEIVVTRATQDGVGTTFAFELPRYVESEE